MFFNKGSINFKNMQVFINRPIESITINFVLKYFNYIVCNNYGFSRGFRRIATGVNYRTSLVRIIQFICGL